MAITEHHMSVKSAQEIERLFREHHQLVYQTARSVTGNMEDAEDVLQSIFTGLLQRELPPDFAKNPRAYFYRAAFNLSLNTVRYRKRHPSGGKVESLKIIASPSDSDVNDELDIKLAEAIAELQPKTAQIVVLRYVHEQSLAAIAELLGTSQGVVAVTLFRARRRLRKRISDALSGENR